MSNKQLRLFLLSLLISLLCYSAASAQTTAFTYQGKLTDGGASPTATYEMQFKVFDPVSDGAQFTFTALAPATVKLRVTGGPIGDCDGTKLVAVVEGGRFMLQVPPQRSESRASCEVDKTHLLSCNISATVSFFRSAMSERLPGN